MTEPQTQSAPNTPLGRYFEELADGRLTEDPVQKQCVIYLNRLYEDLVKEASRPKGGLARMLSLVGKKRKDPVQGLYLWGGVGRGKTHLVDMFYDCLPFKEKKRTHFHRFMHAVHAELKKLNRQPEPLDVVAEVFARDARVICFDEFFVSDITDAMILGGLMRELFKRGVTMVATSNVVPNELYKNGLQRDNFLPAIALIQQHMTVVNVDSGIDYRLRTLEKAEIYHSPLDQAAEDNLANTFSRLSPEVCRDQRVLKIDGRPIQTHKEGDGVVWFDFPNICDGPRSQTDYIEISRCYNTVLLARVPQMGLYNDDVARRFISMVDEFYDRRVKLMISAEVPMMELYTQGNLNFEFKRCLSRLEEMQSHDYLAAEHLP